MPSEETAPADDLGASLGRGEGRAFAAVYDRFANRLYATAVRLLGDRGEAEDAMQETFLTLFRHAAPGRPANLGGWLHRVLVNECLDRLRRRRRRPEAPLDDAPPPVSPPGARGRRVDLERAVARLPERARLVFLLHDVEGLGHAEVGRRLGISTGTSKSQLFRARGLLRVRLAPSRGGGGSS